jgi:hypothetical protein
VLLAFVTPLGASGYSPPPPPPPELSLLPEPPLLSLPPVSGQLLPPPEPEPPELEPRGFFFLSFGSLGAKVLLLDRDSSESYRSQHHSK